MAIVTLLHEQAHVFDYLFAWYTLLEERVDRCLVVFIAFADKYIDGIFLVMVLGDFAISKFVCVLKYVLSGFHDAKLTVVVAGFVCVRVEEWPALGHFKSVERHTIVLGRVNLQGEREQLRSI